MAYTPHDWQTGEVITEELLDHMEEGISEASEEAGDGGAFYIDLEYTIDATDYSATSCSAFAEEINAEYQKSKTIILRATQPNIPSPVYVGQLVGLGIADGNVNLFVFYCKMVALRVMIGADLSNITITQQA